MFRHFKTQLIDYSSFCVKKKCKAKSRNFYGRQMYFNGYRQVESKGKRKSGSGQSAPIGGLQPISRDTDNNAAMYNCWWTNKRS